MTAADYIPPMTDPLGRYWDQPRLEEILMDETHAVMTEATLKKLAKYSCSIPSGVYPGKCWRLDAAEYVDRDGLGHRHWLRWFEEGTDPSRCRTNSRMILIAS